MSNPELTEWFPSTIKPVKDGVYETHYGLGNPDPAYPGYSMWDGKKWGNQWGTINMARNAKGIGIQDKKWRALSQEPIVLD